jgi:uncharacterized protein YgiM (DUF1202 family)
MEILGRRSWLVLALALLPAGALAQEAGIALKDDTLRAEPYADARTAGTVKKGDTVSILKRTSGWYQVKSGRNQGWLRMLSVRRGQAAKGSAAAEAGGVAALSTGRAGTGQVVSTTGVRGLSEEELKAASFDEAQVRKAESHAVSAADAGAFAAKAGLKARRFDYLAGPARQGAAKGQ